MNGIIYCRVSSKEQVDGTSLESQEAACRDFAQAKGIHVLRVFVEQGESAKFADRTQLIELIEFCRINKGHVQTLIVWKVDRFARNVADHFSVKATLGKYGVNILSVTEPIDGNPEGRLMEAILAGFAQFDNDIRAMRTVQGMRRKLKEGIFPWGPPLGYKSSVEGNEKKIWPDLPHEPTFSLLQKAWREFATGAHTKAEMGRLMQIWGIVTSAGESLPRQSLTQLFQNPYYSGVLVDPWTGEEYVGRHVPMVTAEEFARVQLVLTGRSRSLPHQKHNAKFPLRGLVRCSNCGHALTAATSRGRNGTYSYYFCQQPQCSRRGKGCRAEDVHREFRLFLDEVAPRRRLFSDIEQRIIKDAQKRLVGQVKEGRNRHIRIREIDKQIMEVIRMRAQKLITDDELLAQKRHLLAQRAAVENGTGKSRIAPERIVHDCGEIAGSLTHLYETWLQLEHPIRHRFERIILPGGYTLGSIRTATLGPLFSTFLALSETSAVVVPSGCQISNQVISDILELHELIYNVRRQDEESLDEVPSKTDEGDSSLAYRTRAPFRKRKRKFD